MSESNETPKKRPNNPSENLNHSKAELIKNLAKSVLEVLENDAEKIKDPFESYAVLLRMRICKDAKIFSGRSIQGYETLLEHLRSHREK